MMKRLVYFMIAVSIIGAGTLSVSLGSFQLSVYRAMLILLFATIMLADVICKKNSVKFSKDNRYSLLFFAFWFVYALLSVAWVKDYSAWFKTVFFIGSGVVGLIVVSYYLRSKQDILHAFQAFVPMILFHNIVGWNEWATGRYLFLKGAQVLTYQRVRYPVSTFGNTNDFALFLMFSCFVLYVCFMNSKRKLLRFAYIAIMASSVALLFLTKSRACLLGLIIGAGLLIFISMKRKELSRVVFALLALLVLVSIIKQDWITNVVEKVATMLTFDFSQQSGSELVRINLIKNGFEFLFNTFGFGTGAGNVEYWMENYAVHNVATVYNIHNWWMEVLVGFGLIVFVGYFIFYVNLMHSMWKRFKKSQDRIDAVLSAGILSIMVAYIIGGISSSSNMNAEWLWVFWAIAIAYQGVQPKADLKRNCMGSEDIVVEDKANTDTC